MTVTPAEYPGDMSDPLQPRQFKEWAPKPFNELRAHLDAGDQGHSSPTPASDEYKDPVFNDLHYDEDWEGSKNPTLFEDNQRRWAGKQMARDVGYDVDDRLGNYDMSDDERYE